MNWAWYPNPAGLYSSTNPLVSPFNGGWTQQRLDAIPAEPGAGRGGVGQRGPPAGTWTIRSSTPTAARR